MHYVTLTNWVSQCYWRCITSHWPTEWVNANGDALRHTDQLSESMLLEMHYVTLTNWVSQCYWRCITSHRPAEWVNGTGDALRNTENKSPKLRTPNFWPSSSFRCYFVSLYRHILYQDCSLSTLRVFLIAEPYYTGPHRSKTSSIEGHASYSPPLFH